jgi:proline iminopeptidase
MTIRGGAFRKQDLVPAREDGDVGQETVSVPGATLWTDTTGQGSEAVVLCHGGPGLSDNLEPVASMIEDLVEVHRFDQRGGGRSTGSAPFVVRDFIEDLEALRVHWQHDSWIVGGHSWGGWLAVLYAIAHPDRVSGLIGIGVPPPPGAFHDKYRNERARRLRDDELPFFDEISAQRRIGEALSPEDERWLHLLWKTEFADPDKAPDFDREPLYAFPANQEVNRSVVEDLNDIAATRYLSAEFRTITAPALFLHGRSDPRPPAAELIEAMPDSSLVLIPDAGHLPWLENYSAVRDEIRQIL